MIRERRARDVLTSAEFALGTGLMVLIKCFRGYYFDDLHRASHRRGPAVTETVAG